MCFSLLQKVNSEAISHVNLISDNNIIVMFSFFVHCTRIVFNNVPPLPTGYGQPPPQGYAPQQGYPAASYPAQQQQTNQTVVVTQAPVATTTHYVV